jgi:hypothetical protein
MTEKNPADYICPRCGGLVPSNARWGEYPGAISRHLIDEQTENTVFVEVCSDCGVEEALIDFSGDPTPVDDYPLLTETAINRRFEAIAVITRWKSRSQSQMRRFWRHIEQD